MKNKLRKWLKAQTATAVAVACSAVLCLTGCEDKSTRDAKLDGTVVKDGNGRYWLLTHNVGDTYFLKEVKTNGVLQ